MTNVVVGVVVGELTKHVLVTINFVLDVAIVIVRVDGEIAVVGSKAVAVVVFDGNIAVSVDRTIGFFCFVF